MIFAYSSFRTFLKARLAEQAAQDRSYSLTKMSRDLGVSTSALSEVLRGVKRLSLEQAQRVAERLGLNDLEQEYFVLLVQCENTDDLKLKRHIGRRLKFLNPMSRVDALAPEAFEAISEWYHYALLELLQADGPQLDVESAAARLDIPVALAQEAIERLLNLGMIKRDEQGGYRKTCSHPVVDPPGASQAVRSFHRQMLARASDALETQTRDERFIGSETFAFDPKYLVEFRQLAEDFFSRAVEFSSREGARREVYHLGVQFFRLTKPRSLS